MKKTNTPSKMKSLQKSPTGIRGLDEITEGGLPTGRPTLVCGGAGCGKTLLGMEFLVRGAAEYDEPGVFMAFEETSEELTENVASLGFDLPALVARKKLVEDYVFVDRAEYQETGGPAKTRAHAGAGGKWARIGGRCGGSFSTSSSWTCSCRRWMATRRRAASAKWSA